MSIVVPPSARVVIPVAFCMMIGSTAIKPKNVAPRSVMRVRTLEMYSEVEAPGRIPGMNAPFFCRLVDSASGQSNRSVEIGKDKYKEEIQYRIQSTCLRKSY